MNVGEALGKHELGERGALAVEQHMDVARGHALAERYRGDREIVRGQIGGDVSFDSVESCCAHTAPVGDRRGLGRGAERQGHQVIDVGHRSLDDMGIGQAA